MQADFAIFLLIAPKPLNWLGWITHFSKRATTTLPVRPAKAGVLSRRQSYLGKNQKPSNLNSHVAGDQDMEAY